MKVLLANSYFYKLDPKQASFAQPYPPLGTLFAASLLRKNKYSVALFDTNLKASPHQIETIIKNEKPDVVVIYDDGFNYLTKMCLTTMREAAFKMIQHAKTLGCRVVVSSSDSSDHYELYLKKGADFIICGEAELSLLELLNAMQNNSVEFDSINGLAFIKDGEVQLTGKRKVMKDLDILPMPAWDLINMEEYRQIWYDHHSYFSLNIATTRGCPYKCNWCAKPIYGNRYNSRTPENVVDEIEYLVNNHQPDHFWMCDDIFGLKPSWVQEFNTLLKERQLNIRYKIQSRADLLLQEDTITLLSESGLETVWIGAESGSQRILDSMDKGTTIEQIGHATRLLQRKGIKVAFFLQFGYLGETREDIKKTKDMILELMPDEIGISVSYPLPGTRFYDKVKQQLQRKANWTDSDDLDTMFYSDHDRDFYRKLPSYIHKVYRKKRGIMKFKELVRNPLILSKKNVRSILAAFYYVPSIFYDKLRLSKHDLFPG